MRPSVLLHCRDCRLNWTFGLEDVIQRLALRGVGGEGTGIKALAGMVRQPCPRCAGWRFDARPDFPPVPGTPPTW
jgi:hypothetical protein